MDHEDEGQNPPLPHDDFQTVFFVDFPAKVEGVPIVDFPTNIGHSGQQSIKGLVQRIKAVQTMTLNRSEEAIQKLVAEGKIPAGPSGELIRSSERAKHCEQLVKSDAWFDKSSETVPRMNTDVKKEAVCRTILATAIDGFGEQFTPPVDTMEKVTRQMADGIKDAAFERFKVLVFYVMLTGYIYQQVSNMTVASVRTIRLDVTDDVKGLVENVEKHQELSIKLNYTKMNAGFLPFQFDKMMRMIQ